jgi:SAM-dependent methyltransferase
MNQDEQGNILERRLEDEILRVRERVRAGVSRDPEDFNVRGELYRLAFLIAPDARRQDIETMEQWLEPKPGEKSIDIAAGTGFLTKHLVRWTGSTVYAVDPSRVQIDALAESCAGLPVVPVVGSFADAATVGLIGEDAGRIDFVTSFGGIHHVLDKEGADCQLEMFKNVAKVLRPGGRFVAADVGAPSSLQEHFERSVKRHCLTGHSEKWLTRERLYELAQAAGLTLVKAETVPIQWIFSSEHQMAAFMKGLHAYDLTEEEILGDLRSALGYESVGNEVRLNWPMLLFWLQKS